jgi:hypothetical protein
VLSVAFRPDGKELASSSLDGQIYLWDPEDAVVKGIIEGKNDIRGGRLNGEAKTANNSTRGTAFTRFFLLLLLFFCLLILLFLRYCVVVCLCVCVWFISCVFHKQTTRQTTSN